MALVDLYTGRYLGWNVKHFFRFYAREHKGSRSYSWVKNTLQQKGAVKKHKRRGTGRKRREPAAIPGLLLHQDGSTHEWVPGKHWDLIVTMDDATNEHYSMFFVAEEGTMSSFQGVYELICERGLFSALYTDRGSHYWHTPQAGGKVDKTNPTQFGMALKRLGIEMIAAYSPEARGRSERAFGTHQGRLPQELALHGITDMDVANQYLKEVYLPAFNQEFSHSPREDGSAFVPWTGGELDDYLCESHERVVNRDNCVEFKKLKLQVPQDQHRYHYIKARVRVLVHLDGSLSIMHGPRKLAMFTDKGELIEPHKQKNAA